MKPNQHQTSRHSGAEARILFVLTLAFWLGALPSLQAQAVPDYMNYQGILLNGQGAPITLPTDVQFRIWDSATLTETSGLKWGRMFRITPDTNGAFNVVLSQEGALVSGAPDVSLSGVFTGPGSDSRYLELTVFNSTAIRPRQRFVASPYAMLAFDLTPRQSFAVNGPLTVSGAANVNSLTTAGAVTALNVAATTVNVASLIATNAMVGSLSAAGAVTAASFAGSGAGLTSINTNNLVQQVVDALCPPGTIVAYGGNVIPSGWLLCDGRTFLRTDYPRLFSAISTSWGAANGSSFNLPDLRGMFLRGVNGSRADPWADPDTTSRVMQAAGGNSGNMAGTYQMDRVQTHQHRWGYPQVNGEYTAITNLVSWDSAGITNTTLHRGWHWTTGGGGSWDDWMDVAPVPGGFYTEPTPPLVISGTETRSRNVYVNYMIKY